MKEREYQKMKQTLLEKHKRELEALELLWQSMKEPEEANGKAVYSPRGELSKRVSAVVDIQRGDFSIKEVTQQLPDLRPASISTALNRLVELKKLEIVKQGTGRWNPTTYRKRRAESHV